jgi:hypothetical protein
VSKRPCLLAKTVEFAGFSYEITTLITVWLQVRVLWSPPMFSDAAAVATNDPSKGGEQLSANQMTPLEEQRAPDVRRHAWSDEIHPAACMSPASMKPPARLPLPQCCIVPVAAQQLIVRALFGDAAAIEHDQPVLRAMVDSRCATGVHFSLTVWTTQSITFAQTSDTGVHLPGRQLTVAELESAVKDLLGDEPAGLLVQNYSRIIGVSAKCFQETHGPNPSVWDGERPTREWLNVTRKTYLDAIDHPEHGYAMFDLVAAGSC